MGIKLDEKLLNEIIGIRSISSDHKACLRALKTIDKKIKVSRIPSFISRNRGVPFLIAGNLQKAEILFLTHMDVVPAKLSLFQLKNNGNKLIARGVLDMKGPLLVSLAVFINLWQTDDKRFLFVTTTDEEIGGFKGAKLLTQKFKNIKLAIVPDSSSGEKIVICQKAPFHIKIFKNDGVSAHGSKPWEGVNSCEKISQCCLKIVKIINKNNSLKTSAAITQIHSGEATNVIPDKGVATIDVRIKRKREVKQTIKLVNLITKKNDCSWEPIDEPLFFEISKKDRFIQEWANIFRKIAGRSPEFTIESGASDARFLHQKGIPAIITSAKGGNVHGNNEWADKKSLIQFGEILLEFCQSLKL